MQKKRTQTCVNRWQQVPTEASRVHPVRCPPFTRIHIHKCSCIFLIIMFSSPFTFLFPFFHTLNNSASFLCLVLARASFLTFPLSLPIPDDGRRSLHGRHEEPTAGQRRQVRCSNHSQGAFASHPFVSLLPPLTQDISIPTKHGPILVTQQGPTDRTVMITYHDVGYNCTSGCLLPSSHDHTSLSRSDTIPPVFRAAGNDADCQTFHYLSHQCTWSRR